MSNNNAIVNTKYGKLEGTAKKSLFIFKGIPYATPPVGNLRWMPPKPLQSWNGAREAKHYGAISPQNLMPENDFAPSFKDQKQSEDCLYLNIWTPGLDNERRPVFFWIHGGAFILGAGTENFLEEGALAKRGDIVVVSINYRLGALGFLNLNEITNGKIPATGNEGILDQIAALEWVQENIEAFGGDPENITISGFSAGGMSVGTLLGMPKAQGKFHKALNRSGAATIVTPLDDSVKMAERYLGVLNLKRSNVDALVDMSAQQLLGGQEMLTEQLNQEDYRATPFLPVVDGNNLPDFPMVSIKKGMVKDIPVMAGSSLDELKAMNNMDPQISNMDDAGLKEAIVKITSPEMAHTLIETYRDSLKNRGDIVTPANIFGSINADMMFRIPTIRLLEAQRDNRAPAYNYIFTHKSPAMGGALGALHGLDNPFLFGSLEPEFTGSGLDLEELVIKIQDSTAAFCHTGNPSCETAGEWPVYGAERMTMLFDKNTRVEAAPYELERAVWDNFEYLFNPPR